MANIQSSAYERLSWQPGWLVFRFNCGILRGPAHAHAVTWGGQKSHAGVTDLAALVHGQIMVWIEIKQRDEAHLDSQVDFRDAVRAEGGLVYTARTMDDIEAIIKETERLWQSMEKTQERT